MAFFRPDENQSPREKARTAIMGIIARLAGCAYLVYIIFKIVRDAGGDDTGMSPTAAYIICGLMGLATLFVLYLTIRDFTEGIKEHRFDSDRYYDEEFIRQGLTTEEIEELRNRSDETGESMEELVRELEIKKLTQEASAEPEKEEEN